MDGAIDDIDELQELQVEMLRRLSISGRKPKQTFLQLLGELNARISELELALQAPDPFDPTVVFDSISHPAGVISWHRLWRPVYEKMGLHCDFPPEVATMGDDPYPEVEFDTFLRHQGISPSYPGHGSVYLVIGRNGWDGQSLVDIVRSSAGQQLKVYSQEMFAAMLSCGRDPFEYPAVLDEFGTNHPALLFLRQLPRFDWPKGLHSQLPIQVSQQAPVRTSSTLAATGLLSEIGYRVEANSNLSETRRRSILADFMAGRRATKQGYAADTQHFGTPWTAGGALGAGRLRALADAISFQIEYKRRNPKVDYTQALSDWQEDLDWLRATFFDPVYCGFQWPDTRVKG